MGELQVVLDAYDDACREGRAAALATVVAVTGSSYRRPGARMLVTADGRITGGVSGGCLEADVLLRALEAIERAEPTLATYDTRGDDDVDFGVGLGCRGIVHVLIEPLPSASARCHLPLLREMDTRRPAVLATVWRTSGPRTVRPGERMLLGATGIRWDDVDDPSLARQIAADLPEGLCTRRSLTRDYALPFGSADVFFECLHPRVPLVVFGGGRDAAPLVRLASHLGWHVTVVDGRPAAARRDRFPEADAVLLCPPAEVPARVALDAETAAVVMTHSYRTDQRLLEVLLPSPVRYLGLLGPRARARRLLRELADGGMEIDPARLDHLHAPAGLDLGAEGAEEIAVAIVAEIAATLAGRPGGPLRDRPARIHDAEPVEVPA
jgi:xanthine/CO dehydrogenase XdhC/CoxF family maturation factor